MAKETNQIRMFGVLPSIDADPLIVRMAPEPAGGDMIETNKIRMMGILPSQDADPILVEVTNFDAKARAVHSPISISPASFLPASDDKDYIVTVTELKNRITLAFQIFVAPVLFPPGVTVTKLTFYGYRDDAASAIALYLMRADRVNGWVIMAQDMGNWVDGYNSGIDATIAYALINNSLYSYSLYLEITPNDAVGDVTFNGAEIEFTG